MIDDLVLGTVNAPWKRSIDASTLAELLSAGQVKDWLPHVATFFGEVRSHLILAFADQHHIRTAQLKRIYNVVKLQTGELNKELEASFAGLGNSSSARP